MPESPGSCSPLVVTTIRPPLAMWGADWSAISTCARWLTAKWSLSRRRRRGLCARTAARVGPALRCRCPPACCGRWLHAGCTERQIGQIGGHHVDTACNCGGQTGRGLAPRADRMIRQSGGASTRSTTARPIRGFRLHHQRTHETAPDVQTAGVARAEASKMRQSAIAAAIYLKTFVSWFPI